MRRIRLLALTTVCLGVIRLGAADDLVQQWTSFGGEDGLCHTMITDVEQTPDGAMWFSTFGGGIARYDGRNWRTYTTVDGLPSNTIGSLLLSEEGVLWAAAGGGRELSGQPIVRLNGDRWEPVLFPADILPGRIHSIVELDDGVICFACADGGLLQYRDGEWKKVDPADGLVSNRVRSVLQAREGGVWVAYGPSRGAELVGGSPIPQRGRERPPRGISLLDPATGTWSYLSEVDESAPGGVLAMAQTPNGDIWLGTGSGGVLRYDGERWHAFTTEDGLPANRVWAIDAEPDGTVWVGTPAGAARYTRAEPSRNSRPSRGIGDEGGGWEIFTEANGLPNNTVTAIKVTPAGSVWLGTRGGVARFGDRVRKVRPWLRLSRRGTLLERDSDGVLWAAASTGIHRLQGDSWVNDYPIEGRRLGERLVGMVQRGDGPLWVASQGRILRRRDGVWADVSLSGGYDLVLSISPSSGGGLWAGTAGSVWRFDGEGWSEYESGTSGPITAVLETEDGTIWFGTTEGIVRDANSGSQRFTERDGVPSGPVTNIIEDSGGRIWVGSPFGGLAFYDGKTWNSVPGESGITFNEIREIYEADDGTFWIASFTNGGIHTDGNAWTRYTSASGLPGRVWDISEDSQGRTWLATGGGLALLRRDHTPPDTFLSGLPEEVAPFQRILMIFSGKDAWKRTAASDLLFSWRLDDGEWSPPSAEDRV